MSSPHHRTPLARVVVAGACTTALLLGPGAGLASADDASLAKTITERAQQLDKREKALAKTLKTLQASPSLSRAKSASKDASGIFRTTDAFRTEVRDDDGTTDKGVAARDAVLPKLTAMAAAAEKLDKQLLSVVKKRKVGKAQVTKIVSAKLVLDRSIGKVLTAIGEAFASDGPIDPAPKPTDPTE
ncbi:hypothetical protein [Patulibacter minatonensis]|uniref:hypothetical protein n=1 Tax=Patulibacter minatonensis TaxID=298163 RepID=UPI00047E636B|nr:hypothetical protein [Patulibacter minatonensis]